VTPLALGLVCVAALLHATWNLLTKRAGDPFLFLWSSMSLAAVLLAPVAGWLLATEGLAPGAVPFVVATATIHAVYFWALSQSYRHGDFSLVYPIARGMGVGLVPLFAWPLLGEAPSGLGALGIGLVVTGMLMVGLRLGGDGLRSLAGPGTGWAAITGVTIVAYSLVDKAGAQRANPLLYVTLLGAGSTALLAPLAWRRRGALAVEWRTSGWRIGVAALMNLTTYALVLYAFRLAKTGYVVAARELSIVLSVLAGSFLLGEARERRRLVGAAVILVGVLCVSAAR
jgi:drug/metabolite transporter (DMT)-like permease